MEVMEKKVSSLKALGTQHRDWLAKLQVFLYTTTYKLYLDCTLTWGAILVKFSHTEWCELSNKIKNLHGKINFPSIGLERKIESISNITFKYSIG